MATTFQALAAAAIAAAVALTGPAAAEDVGIPLGEETLRVDVGGYLFEVRSDVAVGLQDGPATDDIDLEEVLGLGETPGGFRGQATWRVARRHRLGLGYYSINRKGTQVLETEVEFEDSVYPVGVEVNSRLDWGVLPFSYSYSFIQRPNLDIAGSIGAHLLDLNAEISGLAFIGDAETPEVSAEVAQARGPFPLIGGSVDWRPGERWQVGGGLKWLSLGVDVYRGQIWDVRGYAEYYLTRNLGLGAGLGYFNVDFDVRDEDFFGKVDMTYAGADFYVVFRF